MSLGTNFVRLSCGPVVCGVRHPAFLGATSCSDNTAELTGLAEVLRWIGFFLPRGERVRFVGAEHAAPVSFGVTHARKKRCFRPQMQ